MTSVTTSQGPDKTVPPPSQREKVMKKSFMSMNRRSLMKWLAAAATTSRLTKRCLPFTVVILVISLPVLVRAAFSLKVTDFGGGQIQVLATNISGGIRGYCVWETSSNLITWTPIVTNYVNKTWATNTFSTTNSAT